MKFRFLLHSSYLILVGLLLLACGNTSANTPTPDLVATQVAVEKAAAATLTAEAQALAENQEPAEEQASQEEVTPEEIPATETPSPTAPAAGDTLTSAQPTEIPISPPLCTVVTNGLNLRSGPGTVYEPPLESLSQGTLLKPLTRTSDNTWIEAQVQDTNEVGWVGADAQFISCNIDISGLSLGQIPPTPTPTPTSTSTPTPISPTPTSVPSTPTPPLIVDVPVDGGQSELEGQIIIPGFKPEELKGPESDGVIFRDRLVFRVEVYDPSKGDKDGAGIEKVKITIERLEDNQIVHERTENNAGYCVFGGGEPDCNVLVFAQSDNRWPEEGQPSIENGLHKAFIEITTKDNKTEEWNWSFWIQRKN
jgi:hypothetical protein